MTENKAETKQIKAETNQYKYKGEYKGKSKRESKRKRKHTYNPVGLFLVCEFFSSLFSNIFFEEQGNE